MLGNLEGKVAIVTGAAHGLGRIEALVLAQEDRGHATGAEMPQYAVAAVEK